MSQNAVENFLGRIVTDHNFRRLAEAHIEYACSREGLVISQDELECLKGLNFSEFARVAEGIDDSLRRC